MNRILFLELCLYKQLCLSVSMLPLKLSYLRNVSEIVLFLNIWKTDSIKIYDIERYEVCSIIPFFFIFSYGKKDAIVLPSLLNFLK